MSLFWIIFPIVVFIVVLSWTDMQSHVGYAVAISKEEGFWMFPVFWLQSFIIPTAFLRSGKARYDYDAISNLERALRLILSKSDGDSVMLKYHKTRDIYTISDKRTTSTSFHIPKDGSVEIDGYDKLIPPRLAFLMIDIKKRAQKKRALEEKKPKSLID